MSDGVRETCKTCKYYDELIKGEWGYCQFNAPVVDPNSHINVAKWPRVTRNDYCGQCESSN